MLLAMCYLLVKRSGERASDKVLFTRENIDKANQSVDTSFFTSEINRMTNQLASLARRDYFYLDAFWRVNLGMYNINYKTQLNDVGKQDYVGFLVPVKSHPYQLKR